MTGETTDGNPGTGGNAGDGTNNGQSSTRSGSKDGKGKDDGEGGAAGGRDGEGGGGSGAISGGEQIGDGSTTPGTIDSENASTDSSSPLVPILIALAVLAAISIGVVAMRKKREDADPGAPASTEAG